MKLTRLAALVVVPAAFSLAACSGGSSGVLGNNIGTGGQQANIRFVNGSPDLGSNIDIYLQATGAAAPGSPAAPSTTNMPYAQTSLFFSEPPTAYTAVVRAAGASSGSSALAGLACPIPQLAANAKYTVVISGTNANGHTCRLFQDFDYGTTPQYRVHDAASSLGGSIEYGTTNGATPAAFSASNTTTLGSSALTSGATFVQVQPAGPIQNPTTDPVFVIGTTQTAGNINATDSLDAKSLMASGSLTQPNTAGSLNFPSTAGTSVFAIDCTPAAVAALPGVQCNSGAALVGTFDTL
jgi:predicted small secreted protein